MYNRHLLATIILVFVVATGLYILPYENQISHVAGSNGGSGNYNHNSSNGTTTTTMPPGPQPPVTLIPFQTISMDILGGGNFKPTNLVIDDNTTWTTLWLRLQSNCVDYCPLEPNVNFTSTTVIAVILGQKPTAGYKVEVNNVTQTGHTITVRSTITIPDPSPYCVVAQLVTEPYHIVNIPKTTANVAFDFQTLVHLCK